MGLTPAEIRAVIALAVGMFCVQVDFFALSLALPQMAVDLNQTTTNMQWVLSAYMIAVGAAMIPAGRLGDLRGHRRIVVAGLVVFGGASLVCGLSSSYGLLIGFRALQGLGAAAIFTVSVAAISTAVASDHRGVAIGALYGIANIGTALGPFIGGLLTEQLSWRWVFFLNVPLAAVAILSAAFDGCARGDDRRGGGGCGLNPDRAWGHRNGSDRRRYQGGVAAGLGAVHGQWCCAVGHHSHWSSHAPALRGHIARVVKDGDVVEFAEWAERVVVLTRQGCHLCDEAIAQVAAICAETGEGFAVVDVDSDPELQRRYTDQVPVTFVDGAQHDFWRVDPARLKTALLRTR